MGGHLRGVSMMELLVSVVVVAILAVVGIPMYQKALERTHFRETRKVLVTIYSGEREYYFINNKYKAPLSNTSPDADWREINMDNPNISAVPITFSVAFGTGQTLFTATATRVGGACNGATFTIDEVRSMNPDPTTKVCWAGCGCD